MPRDGNRTLISLLYPKDLDKEDLKVEELLTQTAFNDDPNKRKRIEQLKLRYLGISEHTGPRRRSKHKTSSRAKRAPGGIRTPQVPNGKHTPATTTKRAETYDTKPRDSICGAGTKPGHTQESSIRTEPRFRQRRALLLCNRRGS